MRIGMLTEGGYPYATGESGRWCDRLVRGLGQHSFDLYALGPAGTPLPLPPNARVARTADLGGPDAPTPERTGLCEPRASRRAYGRRDRRRFTEAYHRLVTGLCAENAESAEDAEGAEGGGTSFADGLYALAELARERGGLPGALRSDDAVRALEAACRAPGARRGAAAAGLADHLAFAEHLERALRPLSLDWYEDDALAAADLCHAAGGGTTALPGLLAKRFFGTPLLVTEYGVPLRAHYLSTAGADRSAPLRALLAALHGRLAGEIYRQAALLTPGNAHARRWQEKCGADRARIRTVHPGMAADRFAEVGEDEESGDPATLVWVGRVEPAKDLIGLLHAFAEIRARQPDARLRIVAVPDRDGGAGHLTYCKGLAAQLFPDEATGAHAVGENPVTFEELGGPEAPTLEDTYASGALVVMSSLVEGFPASLVEAMFCARATVSTDVGAVVEIVGGTGLVVPPRNPRALADACLALLRDPERRHRLGAAARARALELFTVEQNLAAFRGIYLELLSHAPVRHRPGDGVPFAHPAEAHVPGSWAHKAVTAGTGAPDA
ncbi:glycosyltransferase [Streptomyces sp. NPDC097704]|uniref:glycosyltransferase n=1 Tax=Streptomyces sp. NPDC097704 TaxID=3157101 RepID=UPI00332159EA